VGVEWHPASRRSAPDGRGRAVTACGVVVLAPPRVLQAQRWWSRGGTTAGGVGAEVEPWSRGRRRRCPCVGPGRPADLAWCPAELAWTHVAWSPEATGPQGRGACWAR
jgi:hypothetical protein